MHPFIGGKSKISKWTFENMPKKKWKSYTEIFSGAFWTYLKRDIHASKVYYNDYNPFLYNLWICMTKHREELIRELGTVKLNDKPTFHANKKLVKRIEAEEKEKFLETVPNFEIASKYVYLLCHCFSGDMNGGMKITDNAWVPFNNKLRDPYYINKLNSITNVYNLDCEDLMDKVDIQGGFMYLDPPYYGKEHLYAFHNFTKEKHYTLADKLKGCKSSWILSYYDYPDLEDLYPEKDYIWLRKEYTRSSSAVKDKPGKGIEVLIYPKKMEEEKEKRVNEFFF